MYHFHKMKMIWFTYFLMTEAVKLSVVNVGLSKPGSSAFPAQMIALAGLGDTAGVSSLRVLGSFLFSLSASRHQHPLLTQLQLLL